MGTQTAGDLLRHWRLERRMSQLELAGRAETSARHLSFIETGRATPSRTMLAHLCEQLDVPLRERNRLLLAAGYAPAYAELSLDASAMDAVRGAMRQILAGHEPYPALAIDHSWTMVDANSAVALLLTDIDPALLAPPVNALRLSLHPDGIAGRIVNLAEWRGHLFARLARQIEVVGSAQLIELRSYPGGQTEIVLPEPDQAVVPLRLRHDRHDLSFLSVTMIVGTPMNVTVDELAIESFYPADAETLQRPHRGGPMNSLDGPPATCAAEVRSQRGSPPWPDARILRAQDRLSGIECERGRAWGTDVADRRTARYHRASSGRVSPRDVHEPRAAVG